MKRPRCFSDGDLVEESPSVKKRVCKKVNSAPSPSTPLKSKERNSQFAPQAAAKHGLQPCLIHSDSAVDVQGRSSPTSPSTEPPETNQDTDWNFVFERLAQIQQERMDDMDQEARRRALLRSVSEPSNIRQLMDFDLTVLRQDHYPPSQLNLGVEDLESLKTEFGPDVLTHLDSLVSELVPKPNSLPALWEALTRFDTNAEVMERKFAGSEFATILLPPTSTTVSGKNTKIQVLVDYQTSLYRGTKENRKAYIFPGIDDMSYLSAIRRADFSYCLNNNIYDRKTAVLFPQSDIRNHFPCHSATFDRLFPFATGEIKVSGHPYKQRFQQAFYASYYIMSWLILRILHKNIDQNTLEESAEALFDGIHHCCFSISPQTLQIWEYRPCLEPEVGHLRISVKLLCSGAPGDQTFMEDVYIPWSRFVLKRGIVEQRLKLLPAIESYAGRPFPRPFDHQNTLFLKVSDFTLKNLKLSNSSFGNMPSEEKSRLYKVVKPYEDALAKSGRKRKSSQNEETSLIDDDLGETDSSQY